uniref:Uncharacterized protein n=1 Tax=Eutreptiella gymnastica TaxID=73025 RepID=A0A7S4CMW2_9EUGL
MLHLAGPMVSDHPPLHQEHYMSICHKLPHDMRPAPPTSFDCAIVHCLCPSLVDSFGDVQCLKKAPHNFPWHPRQRQKAKGKHTHTPTGKITNTPSPKPYTSPQLAQ